MIKRIALALPLVLVAGVAFAANSTLVVNKSGLPIDELFASAPGKKAWGPNLMEGVAEGMLDNGKSHEVAFLADGVYDIKVSAPDEAVLCVIPKVPVKSGKIELNEALGKACK